MTPALLNLTAVIMNISFLVLAVTCVGLFVLFVDTLLLRLDLKTALRGLGFGLLGVAAALNLLQQPFTPLALGLTLAALLVLLATWLADPHTQPWVRLLIGGLAAASVALTLAEPHLLLALINLGSMATIFHLVYRTHHRDLIPLGVAFVLMAVGEYFYYLAKLPVFAPVQVAGAFLYLFAAAVLLGWLWSYFALRILSLVRQGGSA